MLVLTAHGLQKVIILHRINLNLGHCVCPFLTLHFLHIYCCYLDLYCFACREARFVYLLQRLV
nr:MAG TPA: hypothetical protein [Caudoviricetes sp.]